MKAVKFGKKAGLGVVGVGKSAATSAASTTVSVVSTPVRVVNKAKVISDSHDASHYSETTADPKNSNNVDYFVEKPGFGKSTAQSGIRLSQQHGHPLKSTIPQSNPISSKVPLLIDDLGYGMKKNFSQFIKYLQRN